MRPMRWAAGAALAIFLAPATGFANGLGQDQPWSFRDGTAATAQAATLQEMMLMKSGGFGPANVTVNCLAGSIGCNGTMSQQTSTIGVENTSIGNVTTISGSGNSVGQSNQNSGQSASSALGTMTIPSAQVPVMVGQPLTGH